MGRRSRVKDSPCGETLADIEQILKDSTTIAVLFANPRTSAPAYYVPAYLAEQGYRVYPIHPAPAHADKVLFGQPMLQRLDQVPEPIDLLDMFRRAEAISDHVDDILALDPLPRVVWFQLCLLYTSDAADE